MNENGFWSSIVVPLVVSIVGSVATSCLLSGQRSRELQSERRRNAERDVHAAILEVLERLQRYVDLPASPGPELTRESMDSGEREALEQLIRVLGNSQGALKRSQIELDSQDVAVHKSFHKQAEECRKFRRLAQVQRQDWFIATEQVREYPSALAPAELVSHAERCQSRAEDYIKKAKDCFDAARVKADVLAKRWENHRA